MSSDIIDIPFLLIVYKHIPTMNILKNSKGSGISLTQVVVAIVAFS